MLIPTASQILRVVSDTLENVVQPTLSDKVAISAAQTMGHMLRHVTLRVEAEGQSLFDDGLALRALLARIRDYLRTLDADAAGDTVAHIDTLLAQRFRADGAYPTLASLGAEVAALREMLNTALHRLQGLREAQGGNDDYRAIRAAIRDWMRREIEAEARFIEPAFAGRGPRR